MRVLHTDNAGILASQLLKDVCKILHIRKSFSSPRYPQGDGHIERVWQSITHAIRIAHAKGMEWSTILPKLAFAHCTAVSEATGLPPWLMRFGKMPDPLHGFLEAADELRPVVTPRDHALLLADELKEIGEIAEETLFRRNPRLGKEPPDSRYERGDLVLRHEPEAGKLDPSWSGPYEVIDIRPPRCQIRMVGDEGVDTDPWMEHENNLKRYHSMLSYNAKRRAPEHDPTTDTWVVDKIEQDRTGSDGQPEYYVKYMGLDSGNNRWLKAGDFDTPDLVKQYWAHKSGRRQSRRRRTEVGIDRRVIRTGEGTPRNIRFKKSKKVTSGGRLRTANPRQTEAEPASSDAAGIQRIEQDPGSPQRTVRGRQIKRPSKFKL